MQSSDEMVDSESGKIWDILPSDLPGKSVLMAKNCKVLLCFEEESEYKPVFGGQWQSFIGEWDQVLQQHTSKYRIAVQGGHRSDVKSREARSFRCQPLRRKSMVGIGENAAGFVLRTVPVVKSDLSGKQQGPNIYSGSLKQFRYIADRKAWLNHRLAQYHEFHFVRGLCWITPPKQAAGFR